jgi:hypothetical protein
MDIISLRSNNTAYPKKLYTELSALLNIDDEEKLETVLENLNLLAEIAIQGYLESSNNQSGLVDKKGT